MRTSVENEWLCARIVAAYGIPVANCEIGEFGASKVLIVERFDRVLQKLRAGIIGFFHRRAERRGLRHAF